jgi:hypothetical protein
MIYANANSTTQTVYDWQRLPIPYVPPEKQAPIVALVERILAEKKSHQTADISPLEAEIDRLVYQLYGLTDDEIAVVEGKA